MGFLSFFKKVNTNSVFDYLPDGLIVTDLQGKILFANTHAKSLMKIEEDYNLADVLDINFAMIEELIKDNLQSIFKVEKDNGDIYVELSAAKIEEDEKFVITARNVTQTHKFMKKMLVEKESSKKVNRDKNAFIVKMSNDLKSPLHSIEGFSGALLEGLGGELNEKQDKYLNIINKNSKELLFLVDKIIEYSKIEAGLYEWDFKHLDIVNLLQNTVRPYTEELEKKNISLKINVENLTKRNCFADESALKLIFNNILDIADKSTYLGNITIELSHPELEFVEYQEIECPQSATEKSFIHCKITDTGSGMSDSEIENIFDPYFQLDATNKKNMPKSLSLAITKALINNLKGKIWLESNSMQGTTYSFIIPNERLSM